MSALQPLGHDGMAAQTQRIHLLGQKRGRIRTVGLVTLLALTHFVGRVHSFSGHFLMASLAEISARGYEEAVFIRCVRIVALGAFPFLRRRMHCLERQLR